VLNAWEIRARSDGVILDSTSFPEIFMENSTFGGKRATDCGDKHEEIITDE